jgi:hypothetical protein
VADEQQTPIGRQASQLGERLASAEVACKRRMHHRQVALLHIPALRGQLGGLTRARLGAEQDDVKAHLQALQRDPRRARLTFTALGQSAFCIRTRAVGLGVSMTQQPELTSHTFQHLNRSPSQSHHTTVAESPHPYKAM